MPSIQSSSVNTEQLSLSDVYDRAAAMVRRLSASRVGAGTSIPEVRGFQLTWNQNLDVINAWLGSVGFNAEGLSVEVLANGLDDDGRYGRKTATALVVLLYVAGLPDDVAASMPTVASNMPVWYAQHHSEVDQALLGAIDQEAPLREEVVLTSQSEEIDSSSSVPSSVEAGVPDQVIDQDGVMQPVDMGSEFNFEDDTISSSAGRKAWDVPLWALGIGIVTAGGLIYGISRRAKKNARIRA